MPAARSLLTSWVVKVARNPVALMTVTSGLRSLYESDLPIPGRGLLGKSSKKEIKLLKEEVASLKRDVEQMRGAERIRRQRESVQPRQAISSKGSG